MLKGNLEKLGEHGIRKSWKKRWFCIESGNGVVGRGTVLKYYEHEGDEREKGFIDVKQIRSVSVADDSQRSNFEFNITTVRRVYRLRANSKKSMMHWVQGLQNLIGGTAIAKTQSVYNLKDSMVEEAEEEVDRSKKSKLKRASVAVFNSFKSDTNRNSSNNNRFDAYGGTSATDTQSSFTQDTTTSATTADDYASKRTSYRMESTSISPTEGTFDYNNNINNDHNKNNDSNYDSTYQDFPTTTDTTKDYNQDYNDYSNYNENDYSNYNDYSANATNNTNYDNSTDNNLLKAHKRNNSAFSSEGYGNNAVNSMKSASPYNSPPPESAIFTSTFSRKTDAFVELDEDVVIASIPLATQPTKQKSDITTFDVDTISSEGDNNAERKLKSLLKKAQKSIKMRDKKIKELEEEITRITSGKAGSVEEYGKKKREAELQEALNKVAAERNRAEELTSQNKELKKELKRLKKTIQKFYADEQDELSKPQIRVHSLEIQHAPNSSTSPSNSNGHGPPRVAQFVPEIPTPTSHPGIIRVTPAGNFPVTISSNKRHTQQPPFKSSSTNALNNMNHNPHSHSHQLPQTHSHSHLPPQRATQFPNSQANGEGLATLDIDGLTLTEVVKPDAHSQQQMPNARNGTRALWARDSTVNNCLRCKTSFGVFVRKHHCRACGRIFCDDCSNFRAKAPGYSAPERVCRGCFAMISQGASTSNRPITMRW